MHHEKRSPPLARSHPCVCVDVPTSPDRPAIRQFHHALGERPTSSAIPQVEAVDDKEIPGPFSSSSLFFPLTTDRDILTKKTQMIKPQPADVAP